MKHFDKDNRYMGASDLCTLILTDDSIDQNNEKNFIDAYLAQLNDKQTEVQGKAVQCLSKIAPKLREVNLKTIIKQLAEKVLSGEKECRDIYSMCCQSIMNEVTDTNATIIIGQLYPIIQKGINVSEEDIVEEFVDLLSEMIKKFTKILINQPDLINQKLLLENLTERLKSSNNLPLNKKITQCIGNLSIILGQKNIEWLVNSICLQLQIKGQDN